VLHPFTGVDYIDYYKQLIESQDCEAEVILANDCRTILKYTDSVLCCDIHTRERSKRLLRAAGAKVVYGLDDILNKSVDGSGFNSKFGLLGTNKATEETVKLFPNDCQKVVERIRDGIKAATGKNVEAMIYGDGAFKDPVGKIWELADPVVSPFFTEGLIGQPNELKLKYLADNDFAGLSGDELKEAISKRIKEKDAQLAADKNKSLVGDMVSQGTTPRRLTDLIGSLCDLTSGSGDKGTPIVLVQGYFDNYTK
ncbi:MAG: coenzyme F420-0:L-glutamate ligase, partial [Lachnospiraceae bacterium]|nr:coenzyme F420-0:L-glutamate ligase [Lachnospiraceae bacterium]